MSCVRLLKNNEEGCGAERPTLSLSLASHDTKSTSRYRHYTQRTTLYFKVVFAQSGYRTERGPARAPARRRSSFTYHMGADEQGEGGG